jgi:menaquinone-dependent protoporphyrinogen oxidase
MNEIPVLYATTEGHTRRIAERISSILRERGLSSWALDVGKASSLDWNSVKGAVLGASLHLGKYQKRARVFVHEHKHELNKVPSAFFGVSLAAASKNSREVSDARQLAESFAREGGWNPRRVASFSGALAYRSYGFVVRFIIKRIARKEGGPTDTSRNHDLTDWREVERFAIEMAEEVRGTAARPFVERARPSGVPISIVT